MVDHVNVALYLIGHHGNDHEAGLSARLLQGTSLSAYGNVPITYFFSGIGIEALENHLDKVQGVRGDAFMNPGFGDWDPHKPEIGILPMHHVPLVQPGAQHLWDEYFTGYLVDEVNDSRRVAEQVLHRTPVTIHPPDGVYAPAAAHALKLLGLHTVVVSGEFRCDDERSKGGVYVGSELLHLMRTNSIQPQHFGSRDLVDAIWDYAQRYGHRTVTLGCDIDEYSRHRDVEQGIHDLREIGIRAYEHLGMSLVNCNAASWAHPYRPHITDIWGWDNVHAMQRDDEHPGGLGWLDWDRNGKITDLMKEIRGQFWSGVRDVREAKKYLRYAMDIALRNLDFCHKGDLPGIFRYNMNEACFKLGREPICR